MVRLMGLLLTSICIAGLCYLFLRPDALQQGNRSTATVVLNRHRIQVAAASGDVPGARRLLARRAMRLPRPAGARPALAGNPPRGRAVHRLAAPALLRLPASLPDRVIHVPILMYHHVSSAPPATALNYGLTVTDEAFAGQLAYLRDHGYRTVLLRQVFEALYEGKPLPARPVVLTFDDGYLDNYTDALPLLRRFHDVGEFNIISAYPGITLGVNTYMTWSQLRALAAAGMEIGSHTVDHQDLGTLSEDKIRFELRDSRNVLQRTLHVPVQFLAYPSGEPFRHGGIAAQQEVLKLVPQYGYVGALLDGPLTTGRQDARAPFELRRVRVAGGESLDNFAAGLVL